MQRRDFTLRLATLAGSASLAGLPLAARAQAPVAGKDYTVLNTPITGGTPGKIELIEFFWYACPHCYALEPTLEPWVASLPADVHYRLVPYDFEGNALREVHKRVFCTWEALGLVQQMHRKTFERFHRQPINDEAGMLAFAQESGLDVAKVKSAWDSFGVQVKMKQATQTCTQFDIHETPVLAVDGRFKTSPAQAGGNDKVLAVAAALIDRARHHA